MLCALMYVCCFLLALEFCLFKTHGSHVYAFDVVMCFLWYLSICLRVCSFCCICMWHMFHVVLCVCSFLLLWLHVVLFGVVCLVVASLQFVVSLLRFPPSVLTVMLLVVHCCIYCLCFVFGCWSCLFDMFAFMLYVIVFCCAFVLFFMLCFICLLPFCEG